MDIVSEVLGKQREELQKYKPITVSKLLEVRNDIGMMLCSDPNDLDEQNLMKDKEDYLRDLTRDNVQLLINDIWNLPTERFEECIVAKLPKPVTVLPRLRKVPGPKILTKWEKFALEKGITKKKKDKKVYDAELEKWVPTYGYKRAEAEKTKDWVLPVPKNVDPMEDMFQKKIDLRSEKVAKNEIQRMKNILRAKKVEMPRVGYLGAETASAPQLLTAVTVARSSTASIGKFQNKLPKEKEARGIGVKELIPGSKRKSHLTTDASERVENLELIKSVLNKKPKIDVEAAISLQKREARTEREQGEGTTNKKKSKKGGNKKGKGNKKASKKPKGGQGQRAPGKKAAIGRKRR